MDMERAVAEVQAQVRALQRGNPHEAQLAGERLARLQRSPGVLALCARVLDAGLQEGDAMTAFFAAQTLAARARLCADEENDAWPGLAQVVFTALRGAAAGANGGTAANGFHAAVSAPVLRQLCVALARLAVILVETWPDAVANILEALAKGANSNPVPLLDFLQALAEEPFSRRLFIDGSRRSRFLLGLRSKVAAILGAVSAAAEARPSAAPLRCGAAWLRAQPLFEEWLPMVGFGGVGGTSHPFLAAAAPAFQIAIRGARLELGVDGLEAAAEFFEAAVPLATDLDAAGANGTVQPLLVAFLETSASIPNITPPGAPSGELEDVVGTLLTVLHAAFSSKAPLQCTSVRPGLLALGGKLLSITGPSGGLEVDCEGGLMGRCLDAWEALATVHRPEEPHVAGMMAPGLSMLPVGVMIGSGMSFLDGPSSESEMGMTEAFSQLLFSLPAALALSASSPIACEKLRARVMQLLTVWVDTSEERATAMLMALSSVAKRLPPLSEASRFDAQKWSELEVVLTLASAVAEVLGGLGDISSGGDLPEPLAGLSSTLHHLPLAVAPAPWNAFLEVAVADLICALDPYITIARYSPTTPGGQALLLFVFNLANSPRATVVTADALSVVVSNLAPQLAANADMGQEVFNKLRELCIGASAPMPIREKILKSAIGPLLSQLPETAVSAAVEAIAAPLRAMCPPSSSSATPDAVAAARLLFHTLSAPQPARPELALEWLSNHWRWFEAAVVAPTAPELATDTACHALTVIISRARSSLMVTEALQRAVPYLAEAASNRGSTSATSALGSLIRIFKGGGSETTIAQLFAVNSSSVVQRLIMAGPGVDQLPPDLFAAVLELLNVALGTRCKSLAFLLFQNPDGLASVISPIAAMLHSCPSPRIICWGLLLFSCLPHWLGQAQTKVHAAKVIDTLLSGIIAACCRLLVASPVAQDAEVCSTLAKVLLGFSSALPEPTNAALRQVMASIGVAAQEGEILVKQLSSLMCKQVADPAAAEESLSDMLKDTAESWQVDHIRQSLGSPVA